MTRATASGRRPRVCVVGDVMLDVDVDGSSERICPDAPVPVVDVDEERASPGGAGLTALLCTTADVDVTLVAPLADDDPGRSLGAKLGERVRLVPLGHDGATRTKTRVRAGGQTLLRLDRGGPGAPVGPVPDEALQAVEQADVVLVSDYGAGATRDETIRRVLAARAARGGVVWDPHPRGGVPVHGATLVTPNVAEASAALAQAGVRGAALSPETLAGELLRLWQVRGVCVTVGAAGAYLAMPGSEPLFVPGEAAAGDTCGAGDRLAATAAASLAQGAVLSEAVVDGVAAAGAWVAAGGAAAFRCACGPRVEDGAGSGVAVPWLAAGETVSAARVVEHVRAAGGRVVATGGCFDVLHAGHVACLEAARRLGDALVVLLNSDESVRRAKGPGRPAVPEKDRARVLMGLGCVDAVEVFSEDDPGAALERLRPDVWAKGGDYGGAVLPEAEVVRRYGGRVVLLPYLDGRSTTSILEAAAVDHDAPR
ncbi:MAG: PfkB family carbohydrate kinase [Actinomycetes bacterium]